MQNSPSCACCDQEPPVDCNLLTSTGDVDVNDAGTWAYNPAGSGAYTTSDSDAMRHTTADAGLVDPWRVVVKVSFSSAGTVARTVRLIGGFEDADNYCFVEYRLGVTDGNYTTQLCLGQVIDGEDGELLLDESGDTLLDENGDPLGAEGGGCLAIQPYTPNPSGSSGSVTLELCYSGGSLHARLNNEVTGQYRLQVNNITTTGGKFGFSTKTLGGGSATFYDFDARYGSGDFCVECVESCCWGPPSTMQVELIGDGSDGTCKFVSGTYILPLIGMTGDTGAGDGICHWRLITDCDYQEFIGGVWVTKSGTIEIQYPVSLAFMGGIGSSFIIRLRTINVPPLNVSATQFNLATGQTLPLTCEEWIDWLNYDCSVSSDCCSGGAALSARVKLI